MQAQERVGIFSNRASNPVIQAASKDATEAILWEVSSRSHYASEFVTACTSLHCALHFGMMQDSYADARVFACSLLPNLSGLFCRCICSDTHFTVLDIYVSYSL